MIENAVQDRHGHRLRFRQVAAAQAVSVMIIALTAACSGEGSPPVTVRSSPPITAPSGSASGGSDRDQIVAVYNAYWQALPRASVPETQVRELFAQHSTPDLVEYRINGLRKQRAKHQEPWGRIVVHIYSVKISGSTAQLGDCQDASNAGIADSRTHQLIPSTRGSTQPYNFSVTLKRGSDQRWRVSAIQALEAPCTFPTGSGT